METQGSGKVFTKLRRIAELARKRPGEALTTLSHHIDLDWLKESYRRTRKDGAVGIDGRTSADYAKDLEGNLRALMERAKSGAYRAPAVRRVRIPKGTGKETRPIGIPTFEDKVLQRAVAMILEAVYEEDFVNGSYGFRPGRSAHQALQAFRNQSMRMEGCWVLEIDIRKFFDTLDHCRLREILRQRVRDGVLLRLISKWLHAGVMERGGITFPEKGTPQGGVISPILANIYLHEVLDTWFEGMVNPVLKGKAFLVRYADDAVLCFERERDARRVLEVLPKRFGKYGLKLHPEKTRLLNFRKPRGWQKPDSPVTFDLLGFTHYWDRSRWGTRVIKTKTAKSRFSRGLKTLNEWCRRNRHREIAEQHREICLKLRGHFSYFGIPGNSEAIAAFVHFAGRIWRKWLDRRSSKGSMTWSRFALVQKRYPLPRPTLVHSLYRFVAKP